MYPLIRPTAYEPDPAAGHWVEDYQVLTFAERWRTELTELYQAGQPNRDTPAHLPLRQLNALLRAAAPGVVATGRGAASDASVPWVYAREGTPMAVLTPLVTSWAMALRPEPEHDEAMLRVLTSMHDTIPEWTVESVDLTASAVTAGGTARPSPQLYALLPEVVAARLAARPFRSDGVARDVDFRVVVGNQLAELVSWPPFEYERAGRSWFYSAVVTITLRTVPFAPSFRLHLSTGIRRWATGAPVFLPQGRQATLLFKAELPWMQDAAASTPRLIANTMAFSPRLGQVDWHGRASVDLLPELDIVRTYPRAADLREAPVNWIRGQGGIAAGIIHSTAMGTHAVGAGLMPAERARLDAWVEEGLRPMFRPVPALARGFTGNKPALLPRGQTGDALKEIARRQQETRARREALLASLDGQPLDVDIAWQYPETRDGLVNTLRDLLGFPADVVTEGPDQRWQLAELRVHIRTAELGAIGSALEISRREKQSRATALGEAIRARRTAVATRFDQLTGRVGLAIVELAGEGRFNGEPDSDPKFALRLGLADTGRLSQFIQIPDDTEVGINTRAKSAWLDGFRQLGAITIPRHRVGDALPGDLQYLAIWVARRRADGPTRRAGNQLIALRVRPGDAAHPVRGWHDTRKEWVPYPVLLLDLARDADMVAGAIEASADRLDGGAAVGTRPTPSVTAVQCEEIERLVRSVLYQARDRPTLLLANAGNLRRSWPWIGNDSLVRDMLGFSGSDVQRLAAYGPDLRFVLTRDSNGREEVPQWYAPGDDRVGFAAGLWAALGADTDNRVFVSTADSSSSAKAIKRGLLKLGPHPDWPTGPAKTAWNPRYLELTVVGCLSEKALADAGRDDVGPDQPAAWAALAHQLRFHDNYEPLSRPLPLHLAKLAEEYVLPTKSTVPAE
ncbi:pPIWI_RE module domain-containing protein [Frankia sp. Cr1]|uniref:pPIWI_RE module domain-containing protein n=1 Tax=Frankia sp. Cr1 TaxID=3073931 RepID=UPI002AD2E60D|nr:DUF3962 domain-containing protein [Frankia sp. Cr1]